MKSRHKSWVGSISLLLAACSGEGGSDEAVGTLPPAFGPGGVEAADVGGSASVDPAVQAPTGEQAEQPSGGAPPESLGPMATDLSEEGPAEPAESGQEGMAPAQEESVEPIAEGEPEPAEPEPTEPEPTEPDSVEPNPNPVVVAPGPSGLPAPPGPNDLAPPAGAPGDIRVLNWAGFQSAVTYSFDDNNTSQIQNYDTLQGLGVPFTFYLWTNQGSANDAVWRRALADGHEIGNHTMSHNPGSCTPGDINAATQFIQGNVRTTPYTMAAPNGDGCYANAANGLFFINRGVQPAQPVMPNGNSNPLNLNCYIPATNQAANVFNSNIDDGRARGGWVIYVIHGFNGNGFQPLNLGQFVNAVNYAKSLQDVWIGTMVDIGAYWLGQRAFTRAMTTENGDSKTWSWDLPGQFPPGKFLRATVGGGRLSQNGQQLPFDPHGYYEIALDAGSVTLEP